MGTFSSSFFCFLFDFEIDLSMFKKIDRSIDRSKECCDVVGSKTKKQNIHLFFFFCVCVCVAQTPPQPQPLYYFLPKTAKFIKDDSSDDDSSDDSLVATRAKDTARARERKSSGIKCGGDALVRGFNKSRLQKMRRLRRRFRRLRRRQKKRLIDRLIESSCFVRRRFCRS